MQILRLSTMLALTMGCGPEGVFVDVEIDADPCVAELAASVRVDVFDQSGELVDTLSTDGPSFPTGVRLRATELALGWRLAATVVDSSGVLVTESTAVGSFDREQSRVQLEDACIGVVCTGSETCRGGLCVEPDVAAAEPASTLQCPAWLFVDEGGVDVDGCGSFEAPCASAAFLAEEDGPLMAGGGVINIRGGEYAGQISLIEDYGGPVVVRGQPGAGEVQLVAVDENSVVRVQSSDITLQDLDVSGGAEHGVAVNRTMSVRQERIRVRRCVMHDNGFTDDADFDNKSGLMLNINVIDWVVEDSVFRDNGGPPAAWITDGAYINKVENGLLRRNRFESNQSTGLYLAIADSVVVVDNTFVNNGESGAELLMAASIDFEGNRFCGNPVAIDASNTLPTNIVRNSFVDNGVGIRRGNASSGLLTFDQNIFAFNTGAAVQRVGGPPMVDGINLYFENGDESVGFTRSEPELDVREDPRFEGRDDCSLVRPPDADNLDFGAP